MVKDFKSSYYQKFMEKEWFIIVQDRQEGPYSLKDLRSHPYFNPDTLVWKKGFSEWKRARFILELKEVFKDQRENTPVEEERTTSEVGCGQEQMTLTMQQDPYQFWLWILIFLIILFYIAYQLDGPS